MNKLKKSKQIISLLLCMVIMIGILPKQVFAEDSEDIESENFGLNNPTYENQIATFDCVWFGNYMQSGNDETTKEPIKWRVLSVDGNRALLLADKNLDNKRFNDWWNWGIPWESSTLREWMNSDFVDTAFEENEKSALCTKNDIQDKVFALSKSEIETMNNTLKENAFNDDAIKDVWRSTNTDYLNICLEKEEIEAPNTGWWLRSNGMFNFLACRITENGEQDERNINEGDEQGRTMARPSVYLDLTKTDSWSYAGTVSSDGKINEVKKDTEEINENYFSGEKDGWPFANSEKGLGVDKVWHHHQLKTWLSKAGLNNIVSIATLQWLVSYVPFGWPGDCFGLSLSSAGIYTNKCDVSNMFPDTYEETKTLNQYGYQNIMKTQDVFQFDYYTIEGNEEALQFIEGLQLLQYNKEFNENYEVFKNDSLNAIIEYFNDPNDKRIILACMKNGGGHATIIDKSRPIEKQGDIYAIPLYDCNYPSDSQKLLQNPISKNYGYQSYLMINPIMDKYARFVYDYTTNSISSTTDFHEKDDWSYGATFYDVSDVDEKFFSDHNEDLYREILQNTLFINVKNSFSLSDMINGKFAEIQNGIIKEYNENLCDLSSYIGYNEDNTPYILRMDNYNNKDIIVENGTFFIMGENAIYCVDVDGKAEVKLDMENNKVWTKSLEDDTKLSINLQSELSENHKTISAEIVLNNDEELIIQNKNGILTIDSPADKKGNIQLDNAGKIEEKQDVLLKDLNGYNIGTGKKENTSDNIGSDDKKDTKDNVSIDNKIDSNSKGEDKISNNPNNNLSIMDKKEAGAESKNDTPDTGDYKNITLWMSLLVISMFIIGTCGYVLHFKRKKKK